jgi:hypothetical protein
MKGVVCPPQSNPTFVFSLEEFSTDAFNALPDWLKEIVRESDEYKELSSPVEVTHSTPVSMDDESDDIPF